MSAVPSVPGKEQSEIKLANFLKVVLWMWVTNHLAPASVKPSQ